MWQAWRQSEGRDEHGRWQVVRWQGMADGRWHIGGKWQVEGRGGDDRVRVEKKLKGGVQVSGRLQCGAVEGTVPVPYLWQ